MKEFREENKMEQQLVDDAINEMRNSMKVRVEENLSSIYYEFITMLGVYEQRSRIKQIWIVI